MAEDAAQHSSRREEGRPSPDALLALAKREQSGRGRLKIYLGAAPGVGKTFAMLSGAKRLAAEGADVVIGLAETHGRAETAALLDGLVILPRTMHDYRGRTLMEFDLDAALARRPTLLVLDELAHTNAPGSRHPKRHQDVDELLEAGIDVWTALNIQHLESLSDVVSRITGVTVRETVPDTIIERADEVVLVDITAEELVDRLKEGKVYLPESARRAADNFFRPSNLTALRELALRRTAARIDDQMVEYLRQNAIEGPWPTSERILVLVGGDELSGEVVRTAARLATGLNAAWTALTVERPGIQDAPVAVRQRLEASLTQAERLGAEVVRVIGSDIVAEVLRYARRENVTEIVIGRSPRLTWWSWLTGRRSLSEEITARADGLAVQIVAGTPAGKSRARAAVARPKLSERILPGVAVALATAAASAGIGKILTHWIDLPNVSMVFLAGVVLCALTYGRISAIAAAFGSFVAYNFFFIEPLHTLTVARPHEFFALGVFLFVAITVGSLAGRVHDQAALVLRRATTTRALYEFSRKLSGIARLYDLLWAVVSQVALTVRGRAVALTAEGGDLRLASAAPPDVDLGPSEWAAARWAFEKGEVAGWNSPTLPNAALQFRPLRTARAIVGVLGYEPARDMATIGQEEEHLLAALADLTAIAVERIQLVAEATDAAADAEKERLRSALLSSISHDLRTPLASILGSVTSLRDLGDKLPLAVQADLLQAIEEETRRLSQFVANLLDMTRLEAGNLDVAGDWVDIADIARSAVARGQRLRPSRHLTLSGADQPILMRANATLMEQVLFNLIDNADKFSAPASRTRVILAAEPGRVEIRVEDEGPGIKPEEIERVFEKFHRAAPDDGRAAGTGLGLAICRGIVTAMGGAIAALSPIADGQGTRMTITLPREAMPATDDEDRA